MKYILIVGIFTSVLLGFVNGDFARASLWRDADDARIYDDMAYALLTRHSLDDPDFRFAEPHRKSPGYPMLLALSYALIGRNAIAVWILNLSFWLASIFMLGKISVFFLRGRLALLPPFLLSLYWGAAALVMHINSDIFALFLMLLFVWLLLCYQERKLFFLLGMAAFAYAWLVITKPIMLFSIPFVSVLFFAAYGKEKMKILLPHGLAALFIIIIVVGFLTAYNYRLTGTFQLATSATTLHKRADDVFMSKRRFVEFFVASAWGDYIADSLFLGYARDPEPHTHEAVARQKAYAARFQKNKEYNLMMQNNFNRAIIAQIRERPVKFILTSIPYLFRLNTPPNYSGVEITNMFVETHRAFSSFQKIAAIVAIRSVWYVFLSVVIYVGVRMIRKWQYFGIILLLIVYMNGAYALVSHAEARFILPIMPFYFLLLAIFFSPHKVYET